MYDGVRGDDRYRLPPLRPDARQQDPQEAIRVAEADLPWRLPSKDDKLMAQREHLRDEFSTRADRRAKSPEQGDDNRTDPCAEVQRTQNVSSFQ